jgi:hypothetical protein
MSGKRMKLLMCSSVFVVGMSVFVNGRRPVPPHLEAERPSARRMGNAGNF